LNLTTAPQTPDRTEKTQNEAKLKTKGYCYTFKSNIDSPYEFVQVFFYYDLDPKNCLKGPKNAERKTNFS